MGGGVIRQIPSAIEESSCKQRSPADTPNRTLTTFQASLRASVQFILDPLHSPLKYQNERRDFAQKQYARKQSAVLLVSGARRLGRRQEGD